MKHSLQVGLSFGLTSGVITTLGLMVGLNSGTHEKLAVLGGILTIAIADAMSDAFGIHIAEESENIHTTREIWESTSSTFFYKFIFAMTFVVPILLFELETAVKVGVVWGLLVLCVYSYFMKTELKEMSMWRIVGEHLLAGIVVIIVTHFAGLLISRVFG